MRTGSFRRMRFETAIVGVAVGAIALGSIIGCGPSQRTKGAAIGDIVGRYMDKQVEELAKIEGATAARVGDEIKLTWDSAILFDFDSAMLSLESQRSIGQMAAVFARYPDTDIVIAGHTDSTGSDEHNQKLSERRALSLRNALVDLGVAPSRLRTVGHGALHPLSANDTEEGRRLNRRVEIDIRANKELKARAKARRDE